MKTRRLANFNNPKWDYFTLKTFATKYRRILNETDNVPKEISNALYRYNSQPKEILIENLKKVQKFIYK